MTKSTPKAKRANALETTLSQVSGLAFTFGQTESRMGELANTLGAVIKRIAETDAPKACDVFTTAYIAGRLNPKAETLTPSMVEQVATLREKAHYSKTNEPTKDGRARNTLEEKRLRTNARKAWERLRGEHDIERTDARGGGARQPNGGTPPKTPSKTTIPLVAKTPKDAVANVGLLKAGWLSMIAGFKELELTPDELHECNEVTVHLNRLELALGERAKASK